MGEEGGMTRENSMETCTLPYVEWMTSASLMHKAGHPGPVLCDNLEGWGGEGGGRVVLQGGDTCLPVADSCSCMAEAITVL